MIWYLIRTIKETISNKKFVISSFCVLALIVIGTIYASSADSSSKGKEAVKSVAAFGVVDLDQSIYSKMIVQYFQGTESFQSFATIEKGTEEEMQQKFSEGKLSAYLVIPKDFADSLMYGMSTKIKAVINADNTAVSVMLSNMLDSYDTYITNVQSNSFALYELFETAGLTGEALRKVNFDTSIALVSKALEREELFEKQEITTIPHTPLYKYYVWALISLLVVYSCILSGLAFLKEISLGTYARLRIMGHSVAKVLAGILFSNVLLWSAIVCAIVRLMCHVLKIEFSVAGYGFLVLTIAVGNVAFCLLASICKDRKVYMVLGNFGLLLMGVIGGVVFPVSVMPYRFLALAKLSPNYWIISFLIRLGYESEQEWKYLFGIMAVAGMVLYGVTLLVMSRRKYIRIGGDYESF